MRAVFLRAIAGLIAGSCGASAQTIQPEIKGVSQESAFEEKPSASIQCQGFENPTCAVIGVIDDVF
jgi:hypothetical protein